MITINRPGPGSADSEPESIGTGVLAGPHQDSTIVVRLPEKDMEQQQLVELVEGAVTASSLLNLPELFIYATAEQLPQLAVATAEVPGIPEGFRLCQIDVETGELPDLPATATTLSVESLLRLNRARQAV
ncbi:hypothetical protein [Corynebacterium sp. A21]|uniref:hypothetical protein n=1 Tax=Corynebacterium sp. A21 TaxID=3457318 RepID=UPI003FD43D74